MAKKNVLYIEDSVTDAEVVKEIFEEHGFNVEIAVTGKGGLRKAKEMKPVLIVVDLILPDIDGVVLCSQLKQEPSLKDSVIIVLSVKDNMDIITRAFRAGADDYIIKPLVPNVLIKKLKKYLETE